MQEKIVAIRGIRNTKNIAQKIALELFVVDKQNKETQYDSLISKLCNLSSIQYINDKKDGALSAMVRTTELFIPIGDAINKDEEREKLQKDLAYYQGFEKSITAKLSNEKFVGNAPQKVVDIEKKKLSDTQTKIKAINEQIQALG